MSKIRNRARGNNRVFAPLVFRLALRLEQVHWSELQESTSEVVFVARSGQKLFRSDVLCPNFDTWLELEATGVVVTRDEIGIVSEAPGCPQSLPAPGNFAKADVIVNAAEVVRRLSDESASAPLPLASVTFGSTMMNRLFGATRTSEIMDSLRAGTLKGEDQEAVAYIREATLEIATAYLEAGAAGLLLLHEDNSPDLPELSAFAAVFNLTSYYDVPAIVMCKEAVSEQGLESLDRYTPDFYVTPLDQSSNITALPKGPAEASFAVTGWLGLSRWETDASANPDLVHNQRRLLLNT